METFAPCPHCKGNTLYRSPEVSSGNGHVDYLPGLGPWYRSARFVVVTCRDCGLMRFFASPEARKRLGEAKKWKHV
jgi:hypothetical protein